MARSSSVRSQLLRAGFLDLNRALSLIDDAVVASIFAPGAVQDGGEAALDDGGAEFVEALGRVADPDQALLGLVRILDAAPAADRAALLAALQRSGVERDRVLAVLGLSTALIDHLVKHPGDWTYAAQAEWRSGEELRQRLVAAVGVDRGDSTAYDALRMAYRRELLTIAALDLTTADPRESLMPTAEHLAWLADAALEAGLAIAREETPGAEQCRLAIIGMGKTGGDELNYVSDVDVIFVAEPADGVDEATAMKVAGQLALGVMKACSQPTSEGSLWPVDAALRPEGKAGPLVRTVASHKGYYERWAKTWEFQALLKANFSAGDVEVGRAYLDAIQPMVWQAASRENFVEDVQAMRRRVEAHVPANEAARQLKLGPGGLRDVEFSIQLLQLVHGRSDDQLRSATTMVALEALAKGGYVGRDDAATLDTAYRTLRSLEHRIQLHRLRRTHLMPTDSADLRRLGRAMGLRTDAENEVLAERAAVSREVRRIHERLFYRPLLAAAARLTPDEAGLSPDAAAERLKALGFRDPVGAMRHLQSLSSGVSRRALIQRQLLPVMLGWFADEADPDAGLLAFRRVSDDLGATHWYLKMLRDEGRAAERLAHVLARSRYVGDLLIRSPKSVAIFGAPDGLEPRDTAALVATMSAAASRKSEVAEAGHAVRSIRRTELLRIAVADLTTDNDLADVGAALSDLTAATIEAMLEVATRAVAGTEDAPLVELAVIGMGSLGGREMGYASDADVVVLHRISPTAPDGTSDSAAAEQASKIVQELRRLLGGAGPDPALEIDADLRPEGKAGALSRSIASYRTYLDRWADTWEMQALLRARPVAGSSELAAEFLALIDPYRYPAGGITAQRLRDIRTMKARVEAERLPKGADPRRHLKLGRGGATDIEWVAQVLQLKHAHRIPELRVTGTVAALTAAEHAGLITAEDLQDLAPAWSLASRMRNASMLWRGRAVTSVPGDLRDREGIGRILGAPPGEHDLEDLWLGSGRRARRTYEKLFFEN